MNNEIKEISDIISDNIEFYDVGGGSVSIDEEKVAKAIYNADYRKQETCTNISDCFDEFLCSKCGYQNDDMNESKTDDDGEECHYDYQFKYCPNCGAKIKGE